MGPDHLIKKELARSKAPSNIAAELTAISAACQEAKLVPPESLAMNSSASTFAAQVPRLGGLDGGQRLAALFLAMFGFPSAMDATPRTVPRVYQQAHDAVLAKTPSTADGPTAPTPDRAGRLPGSLERCDPFPLCGTVLVNMFPVEPKSHVFVLALLC